MKDTLNIVITNLSLVAQKPIQDYLALDENLSIDEKLSQLIENTYFIGDTEIKGVLTNEAGVRYIMKNLKKNNDSLDMILFTRSSDTGNNFSVYDRFSGEVKTGDINHREFFKKRMELYCQNEGMTFPEYIYEEGLHIDDDPDSQSLINLSGQIANKIISLKNNVGNRKINLYIESNGGIRDFMLLVVAIVQSISADVAEVKDVVGVNFNYKNQKHPIRLKTQAYRVYDLYSGIDEFINYGRSAKIQKFFDKDGLNENEKNILESIEFMSIAFTLCRPIEMLRSTQKLSNVIKEYRHRLQIFDLLVNRIKTEYQKIFNDIETGSIESYAVLKDLIQYCMKHNLIQQALTLYSELMPDVLYNERIIYPQRRYISNNHDITFEKAFGHYYENFCRQKHQTKGYSYIQTYMLIYNNAHDSEHIENMPLINIYNLQNRNHLYGNLTNKFKILLKRNYIYSKYKNNKFDQVVEVYRYYCEIKNERNKTNHASTDQNLNTNLDDELNRIKTLIESGLNTIDCLLN